MGLGDLADQDRRIYGLSFGRGSDGESTAPYMADPHEQLLPYLWTFAIDLAVFFALYRHTQYSLVVHALISLFIGLTTLITAFYLLIQLGVPSQESNFHLQRHAIIGLAILFLLVGQIVVGATVRILQFVGCASSAVIYRTSTVHKYAGYALIILGKVQAYLMLQKLYYQTDYIFFWSLTLADIALFLLFIARKYRWPTLSSTILPHNSNSSANLVSNLCQLRQQYQHLGIFANYIYDLSPLLKLHPIGYKIIELIRDRELDRYLYGMYRSEKEPSIPTHSHGFKALALVGNPLAKLDIPPLYFGLEEDCVQVKIVKVREISGRGGIYEIQLSSEGDEEFQYRGYQRVQQLGRYYSLTLDKKITRLYTTVGFLTTKNINFMKEECFSNLPTAFQQVSRSQIYFSSLSIPILNDSDDRRRIKIMVRRYPTGQLSEPVIERTYSTLWLSTARGRGLRFGDLKPGKIIIVAGGTGLFPFCDLIDLLYKSRLIQSKPRLRSTLQSNDPILRQKPFRSFSFELLLSVNILEDIHPLVLAEINQLVKEPQLFQMTLRCTSGELGEHLNRLVTVTSEQFQRMVQVRVENLQFQKIYICGPPKMNESMTKIFDRLEVPTDKYLIL